MTLTLPYPPSTNRAWRSVGGRVLLSAPGRRYRRAVAEIVAQARAVGLCGPAPLDSRLAVSLVVAPPDLRRRDLDNLFKVLLDACTHAGLWEDDALIDDLRIVRGERVPGGAVVMHVEPLGVAWARAA